MATKNDATGFIELEASDFEVLFKSERYPIGKTEIMLAPLSMEKTTHLVAVIRADWETLAMDLAQRGINLENAEQNIPQIGEVLFARAPMVLSILTGLDPNSIMKMPVAIALDLFVKAVDINLRDHDFFALMSKVTSAADRWGKLVRTQLAPMADPDAKPSESQSKNSSQQGIASTT